MSNELDTRILEVVTALVDLLFIPTGSQNMPGIKQLLRQYTTVAVYPCAPVNPGGSSFVYYFCICVFCIGALLQPNDEQHKI